MFTRTLNTCLLLFVGCAYKFRKLSRLIKIQLIDFVFVLIVVMWKIFVKKVETYKTIIFGNIELLVHFFLKIYGTCTIGACDHYLLLWCGNAYNPVLWGWCFLLLSRFWTERVFTSSFIFLEGVWEYVLIHFVFYWLMRYI